MKDTGWAVSLTRFGAPSAETTAFNARLEEVLRSAPAPGAVPIEAIRRLRSENQTVLPVHGPLSEGAWRDYDAAAYGAPGGPGRLRVVAPQSGPARALYLYIHGGGWCIGAPEQFDGQALRLARAAGVETMSAAYRLAPEHPWPACAEDCVAAARIAIETAEARGLPLFIGGSSAGAHLTAVTLQRLRPLGLFDRIAGAVMIYGVFDLAMTPSAANWGDRLLVLSTPVIDWFLSSLLPDRALAATPDVSPLKADWRGAPPALFQVGTEDPLLDDTLFMAERWRAAEAEARLAVFPGGAHAFDVFDAPEHALPIALQSQAETARFIDERLRELGR